MKKNGARKTALFNSGRLTVAQAHRIVFSMPTITLPSGKTFTAESFFSRSDFVLTLKKLEGTTFTGYLSVITGEKLFLLFFFQGRPYAAGISVGEKPAPLTISNFCAQIATIKDGAGRFALQETDPVLLKCLLVFIQEEPAARGSVNLINLKGMVQQIHSDASDALVILEDEGKFNFFFFLDGIKTAAYWSDDRHGSNPGLSVDEQMLMYAYRDAAKPIDAIVYQTLNTMESCDSSNMSLEGLIRLFSDDGADDEQPASADLVSESDPLVFKVLEGPQAGISLSWTIPCVLGRKDVDIIINDPMVSKRHAAVQLINGRLVIMDLHSTNGTTLNSEPVTQRELKQGDRIGMGHTVLLLESVKL